MKGIAWAAQTLLSFQSRTKVFDHPHDLHNALELGLHLSTVTQRASIETAPTAFAIKVCRLRKSCLFSQGSASPDRKGRTFSGNEL